MINRLTDCNVIVMAGSTIIYNTGVIKYGPDKCSGAMAHATVLGGLYMTHALAKADHVIVAACTGWIIEVARNQVGSNDFWSSWVIQKARGKCTWHMTSTAILDRW